MKKLILAILALVCFIGLTAESYAWDEGGWDNLRVPFIRKTSAPAVTDDDFAVPFLWINESTNKAYLLTDNSTGAAVWQEITYVGGSPSFVTVDLTGVTDGNIPYMQAAGAGFGDSPLSRTDASTVTLTGTDPALIFNVTTATDTDFWMGVTEDADGVDDDKFQIGKGTVKGTTPYVTVDKDGNMTVTGTANVIPQYKTIFIPAASMTPTSTNGALPGTTEYVTNDINKDYLAFDATTEQYADVSFPMPEGWNLSTVKVKFYWTTETGSTAGDTVEWEIAGVAVSNDDAIDTALGTAQVVSDSVLADNGTDLQVTAATPALTVGGTPALGDLVHWKVSRNVSGTDSCSEDAHLFGVLIQYLDNQAVAAW